MKYTPAEALAKRFEDWLYDDMDDEPEIAKSINGMSLKEISILISLHCRDKKFILAVEEDDDEE